VIKKKTSKRRMRRITAISRGNKPKRQGSWQLWIWMIFVVFAAGIIIRHLVIIQVFSYDKFFSKARSQHQYYEELTPRRGKIYFQNKDNPYPVVVNEERDMVIAVPKNIVDIEGTAMTLATVLNIPVEEVREKITKNRNDMYEVIKKQITDDESLALREKNLLGVELIPEYYRSYTAAPLGSQLVGFLGYENDVKRGQYGVEGYFNEVLKGKEGFLKAERDTGGRWISIGLRSFQEQRNGDDLVLTIEQAVQLYVEKKLEEAVKKFGAESGNLIVMNPNNGHIIAMANYPTYDNSKYSEVTETSLFQNKCIQAQYEPGSIMKPFTISVAMNEGKIEPETTYNDTGNVAIAGYNIQNSDGSANGKTSMTEVLELSLNTGAIFAQRQVEKKKFKEYFERYGFGEKLGIDLIGEANGDTRNLANMKDINYATASFGQGVSMTPLQMAVAMSALVNGGQLMKPQIVDKVIDPDGKETEIPPKLLNQVINSKTSSKIKAMLVAAVKNGWGKKVSIPGYLIGGKTGTAQVPNLNGPGYSSDTIHSFLAVAPINNPQFVVLTKLDKVSAVTFAADSACPITREIFDYLFEYYNIPPTEEISEKEMEEYKKNKETLREFLSTPDNEEEEENEEDLPEVDDTIEFKE